MTKLVWQCEIKRVDNPAVTCGRLYNDGRLYVDWDEVERTAEASPLSETNCDWLTHMMLAIRDGRLLREPIEEVE